MIDANRLYGDTELIENIGKDGLLLYILLWSMSEDFGAFENNPKQIHYESKGVRLSVKKIQEYLETLERLGKIILYRVDDKEYYWLKNFFKYQKLSNASLPNLPLPEWIKYKECQYPGGRKYAQYNVDTEKLPVAYMKPVRGIVEKEKRKRSEDKRKENKRSEEGKKLSFDNNNEQSSLNRSNNIAEPLTCKSKEFKVREIAEELGEVDPIKSTKVWLGKYDYSLIKRTWEIYGKRTETKTIKNCPAYFNSLLEKLHSERK